MLAQRQGGMVDMIKLCKIYTLIRHTQGVSKGRGLLRRALLTVFCHSVSMHGTS